MAQEILDIKEIVHIDDSIANFEYIEKDIDQGTANLGATNTGELTITYSGNNQWMCPSKSYLIIEGTILRNAAPPVLWTEARGSALSFINNGLMHLFTYARYYLGTQLIEYFDYPGNATTIHNYLTITKSKTYSGIEWMWAPDTFTNTPTLNNDGFAIRNLAIRPITGDQANPPPAGDSPPNYYFSCLVPLANIFNFCEQYKKVMIGVDHKISFNRQASTVCFMRNATGLAGAANLAVAAVNTKYTNLSTTATLAVNAGGDCIINLTKFRWAMPYVTLNPESSIELMTVIKDAMPIDITFINKKITMIPVTAGATTFNWTPKLVSGGVERPRYIVCAFQVNRGSGVAATQQVATDLPDGTNIGNTACYSSGIQVNVIDAYITVNGMRYPYTTLATSAANNQYTKFYHNYVQFYNNWVGDDNRSEPCLSMYDFFKFNTLYVFDVSHQPPPVNNSTADIVVNFTFGTNITIGAVPGAAGAPANTNMFIMCYYDSKFLASGENGNRQVIQIVSGTNL